MNWNLVWWFVGVVATVTALRFVLIFFKEIFSKDNMLDLIDAANHKIHKASKKLSKKMQEKAKERKEKKKAAEEGRVVAYIR